jgi:thiamine biosynthesis lipoprotein
VNRVAESALPLAFFLALNLATSCASPPPVPVEVADGRLVMGTALEVKLLTLQPELARRVLEEVFAEAEQLDALLSHFDRDSEVTRLATQAGQGPQAVDERLADIVRLSLEYGELTRGAFDVTLGPLTLLWREKSRDQLTYEEVAKVRALTGLADLRIDASGRVELAKPGMSLDFGGIAKGYALDRVLGLLQSEGIEAALASFGQSSVWALGAPPGRDGWELALRSPSGGFAGIVTLVDSALSVSSSFAGPGEPGEIGHIVDPRSGWPLNISSMVAVVSDDATRAEALSTALLLMHHEQGLDLIERQPNTEVFIVDDFGRTAESSGWSRETRFREIDAGFRGLAPR